MISSRDCTVISAVVSIMTIVVFLPAIAQQPDRPAVTAVRVATPPRIDGLLGVGEWNRESGGFLQQSPSHGRKPSERTSVWIAYDDKALYVAARLHDSDPKRIVRNVGRRDVAVPSDWFEIAFDSQHDRRTAYVFRVTAAGGIADGVITEETRRDNSWNGNWTSAVTIDATGWSVEMEIPLSEIRFTVRDPQTWGVNASRWIHRRSELSVLALAPSTRSGSVAYFAELKGLAGIAPPSRLELIPFAVSRLHLYEADSADPLHSGNELTPDAGLDLNYMTSGGTRISATLNPDFGQVEVDPASVNLTTFETTYPEKRPFFTEGAGALQFGDDNIPFFYSRRIGRGIVSRSVGGGFVDYPERARILGALRMRALPAEDATLGLLAAITGRGYAEIDSAGRRREEEVEPAAVYAVARDQHQFKEGLDGLGFFIGGVGRDLRTVRLRNSMNEQAVAGGIDGWLYLDTGRVWLVKALGGASYVGAGRSQMTALQRASQRYFQRPDAEHLGVDTSALSMTGWMGRVGVTRQEGSLSSNATVTAISPGFEINDIGILRQADRISASASVDYGWYEATELFLNRSIGIAASHDVDFGGTDVGSSVSLYGSMQFVNAWGGSVSLSHFPSSIDTRATRGGPSIAGPSGWSGSISAYTDDLSGVSLWADASGSTDSEGSESIGYGGGIAWRPSEGLSLSVAPWWDRGYYPTTYTSRITDSLATATFGARYVFAGLRQTSFSTDIRLNWTPTPRLSLQLYLQPYSGTVRYDQYKQLARAGTNRFELYGEGSSRMTESGGELRIDPDGDGPADQFSLYNSDFTYESLRGTISIAWEYLPGSSLYLVWTELRSVYEDYWTPEDERNQSLLAASPDDTFALKVTWLLAY